jgi:outer membrane receptor protein involved in Fe transport
MLGAFYFDETVNYDNVVQYDADMNAYGNILSMGAINSIEQLLHATGQLPPEVGFLEPGQGAWDYTGQDDKTTSLFGQADWHFTDQWTLTGGLNYTKVKKNAYVNQFNTDAWSSVSMVELGFAGAFAQLTGLPPTPENIAANPQAAAAASGIAVTPCSAETGPFCNPALELQPYQFLPPFLDFPNSVEPGKSNDSKVTWTAVLAYQWTDSINVYARAGTGFKATSWNLSRDSRPFAEDIPALLQAGLGVPNLRPGSRYAGPEDATVYELGFKGNWATTSLHVALFDQQIKGFQSTIFTGTGFVLLNAGKQSTKGAEVEFLWVPTDAWKLTFASTWLDPKYDSFPFAEGVDGPEDLSGTTPPGVHKITIDTSATYYFQLGSVESFIRGEYTYADKVQLVENVPADIASAKIGTFNGSLGFGWSNGLELIFWGRNLFNDEYLLTAFPATAQPGSYNGYPNQPRTYGVTLRASF